MSIESLRAATPDYAKDIRLNLGSLASETVLNNTQKWGCFVSTVLATGNGRVIRAILEDAAQYLDETALNAAKSAASIMAMNNVYYRFLYLTSNSTYKTLPAKLRRNVLAKPGVDKADFELWSLAVSALNGCAMCVDSHEDVVREAGVTSEQIQAAVRIAAVVNAAAAVLGGEAAIADDASGAAAA